MSLPEVIAEIENGLSAAAKYFGPGTLEYDKSTTYYWGGDNEHPAIVIQPATRQDVSVILTALAGADPSVGFAVKGGGHIAVPGFNCNPGILVDMALFRDINYNPTTTFVDIGPGLVWEDVYNALSPLHVNVAGATTCQGVGVAGFNLGGGYGNKTNQFGLAIDNIQAMEVVVPTGEALIADAQNNEDLFFALRGGGNNFGIVTKWTLATHPQGDIYDPTLHFEADQFDKVIAAILEFTKQEVPKSNVEAIFEWTLDVDSAEPKVIANVELFHDGPNPPPGLFDPFTSITHKLERLDRTWTDRQNNLPGHHQSYRVGRPTGTDDLPKDFRGRFSSVMVSHYTEPLIRGALHMANTYSKDFAAHGGVQIYPDIWPFLPTIFDNSPQCAWPHTKGKPSTPLVINFKWLGAENDAFWLDAIEKMTADLRALALIEGCTTMDAAQYYNLSLDNVTATEVYRGNMDRLVALRKKFDPLNVMSRTGGFRI